MISTATKLRIFAKQHLLYPPTFIMWCILLIAWTFYAIGINLTLTTTTDILIFTLIFIPTIVLVTIREAIFLVRAYREIQYISRIVHTLFNS